MKHPRICIFDESYAMKIINRTLYVTDRAYTLRDFFTPFSKKKLFLGCEYYTFPFHLLLCVVFSDRS